VGHSLTLKISILNEFLNKAHAQSNVLAAFTKVLRKHQWVWAMGSPTWLPIDEPTRFYSSS
jgi:hypothetical protein